MISEGLGVFYLQTGAKCQRWHGLLGISCSRKDQCQGRGHSNTSQSPFNDSLQQRSRRHSQEEKAAKPKHGQRSIPHRGLRNKALPRRVQPQAVSRSHMGRGRAWAPGRARVPTPSFLPSPHTPARPGRGRTGSWEGESLCVHMCVCVCTCVHPCVQAQECVGVLGEECFCAQKPH